MAAAHFERLGASTRFDRQRFRRLDQESAAGGIDRTLASGVETIGEAHELGWKITTRWACGKWSGIIGIENAVIVDSGWLSEIWNLRSCQGVSYWSAVSSPSVLAGNGPRQRSSQV
jgi:hypothetical protein